MKSTNDIKLESTLLPYDSFRCSVLMIICSPWYYLFIKMIYLIIKLDNISQIAFDHVYIQLKRFANNLKTNRFLVLKKYLHIIWVYV